MKTNSLWQNSQLFLDYLDEWLEGLPDLPIGLAAPNPEKAALLVVDLTNGFCNSGALASPRVKDIVPATCRLLQAGWDHGIRQVVLVQDAHDPKALEFSAFPPHCVRGTPEAETVREIQALPFYDQMLLLEKNSTSSSHNTGLGGWLADHPQLDTFILAGDCTDICVYEMALDLKTAANATQTSRRVIVPANVVATYDRPVSVARQQGGLPHDGDLLHAVFLYHMALSGVEVCRAITTPKA